MIAGSKICERVDVLLHRFCILEFSLAQRALQARVIRAVRALNELFVFPCAAVLKYRDVMGATDPSKAADGTIRKVHAKSIGENSVHGSDAPETAAVEIAQFFAGNEIVG